MEHEQISVTRFEQKCSILWCERTRRAAAIDPGGDIHLVLNFLDLMDLQLEVILLTHGHLDHAAGAASLSRDTGARIEGPHRGDAHLVSALSDIGKRARLPADSYEPERWLENGDTIRFGDVMLDVLHCPGHTPGHVVYFSREHRLAFVGDILFRHAIGTWTHGDGDFVQLVTNIRTKLFPLGDDVRFVPGHGPMSNFGHERAENPFVGDAAMEKWPERLRRELVPGL